MKSTTTNRLAAAQLNFINQFSVHAMSSATSLDIGAINRSKMTTQSLCFRFQMRKVLKNTKFENN